MSLCLRFGIESQKQGAGLLVEGRTKFADHINWSWLLSSPSSNESEGCQENDARFQRRTALQAIGQSGEANGNLITLFQRVKNIVILYQDQGRRQCLGKQTGDG